MTYKYPIGKTLLIVGVLSIVVMFALSLAGIHIPVIGVDLQPAHTANTNTGLFQAAQKLGMGN